LFSSNALILPKCRVLSKSPDYTFYKSTLFSISITKFHAIIVTFDQVVSYYARSPREFSIFTMNGRQIYHCTISVCGAIMQTFYKLNLKPKTILELKGVL